MFRASTSSSLKKSSSFLLCDVKKASKLSKYRPRIGVEIHAQIISRSKMFSRSPYVDDARINRTVSLFDIATPGTLPMLSKSAVLKGVKAAVLLNCEIPERSQFERKHYFYADMPAGYQITQQKKPIAMNGYFDFFVHSSNKGFCSYTKRLKILRIQLEIDSGKTIHDTTHRRSLIDYNRAGVGLLEIVTEPELNSALEAKCFCEQLRLFLMENQICGGLMHKAQYRVDANISLGLKHAVGVRTEVKNLNSLKMIFMAINHEINRQHTIIEGGGSVVNETLTVNRDGSTVGMRDKELDTDYRFMPEPNLPELVIDSQWINEARNSLSQPRYLTYIGSYGMDPDVAIRIAADQKMCDLVEKLLPNIRAPSDIYLSWLDELSTMCKRCSVEYLPSASKNASFIKNFACIINLNFERSITRLTAIQLTKQLLNDLNINVMEIIEVENLWQLKAPEAIEKVVCEVFQTSNSLVKKAKSNSSPRHTTRLRNLVVAASNRRIDVNDAYDAVIKMLNVVNV